MTPVSHSLDTDHENISLEEARQRTALSIRIYLRELFQPESTNLLNVDAIDTPPIVAVYRRGGC